MGLVGWYGQRDDAEAEATLLDAVERGVTHFDTARSYQDGDNERFVGRVLAPILRQRRERLFIASKYGIIRDAHGVQQVDNQPASLRTAVEASLQCLGVDYLDLYYLHRIDRQVSIEESVGALAGLVSAGKVRYIGLSECSVATLRRACAVHPIAAVQCEFSLWSREPESELLAACAELGVGLVAYSPLGRGFLAGQIGWFGQLPAGDVRRNHPRFQESALLHNRQIQQRLAAYAANLGCTAAQLALAWVLAQGDHVLPIPGTKRRERLQENLGALDLALSAESCLALAELVSRIGVQGDRYSTVMMRTLEG